MNWPQITLIFIWAISLGLAARDHGKPKEGNDNMWYTILGVAIYAVLLHFGGFWREPQ